MAHVFKRYLRRNGIATSKPMISSRDYHNLVQQLLTADLEYDVLRQIAQIIGNAKSKKCTRVLLRAYDQCDVKRKESILELFSYLHDYRCAYLLKREWQNCSLRNFARCYAFEELATLYAMRKKYDKIVSLIREGLHDEPYLQLASLSVTCHLGNEHFPISLKLDMLKVSVVVDEIRLGLPGQYKMFGVGTDRDGDEDIHDR